MRTLASSRHRWRLTRMLALLAVLTSVLVAGIAGPASASVCKGMSGSFSHRDGVARVSWSATYDCSNHTTRVWGTLYDTLCDNRSVNMLVVYDGGTFGNTQVNHGGGCNTSRSFDVSAGTLGSSVGFRLKACNSWGCSYEDRRTYYF